MSALGWAINGISDAFGADDGIGAEEFFSDSMNLAATEVASGLIYDIGTQVGTDGKQLAERLGGQLARRAAVVGGARNYRQFRSAVRAGRAVGRATPQAAIGVGVFLAFYGATTAAICGLE